MLHVPGAFPASKNADRRPSVELLRFHRVPVREGSVHSTHVLTLQGPESSPFQDRRLDLLARVSRRSQKAVDAPVSLERHFAPRDRRRAHPLGMTKENPTTTNGAESYDLADTLARTIAEADASSSSNDDPQARVDAALACPCVADLRSSTCGKSFDAALTCFMLAEER